MRRNKKKKGKNDFPISLLLILIGVWIFTLTQFFSISLLGDSNSNNIEKRMALVIGNSDYKHSPLKNTKNDAEDMAKLLSKMNFQVILEIDTNHKKMEDSIRNFGKKLKHFDIGLFYYSGHGLQINGNNYLIPVGSNIQAEDEVKFKSVNADFILSKMKSAKNKINIVILDACRNNPFSGIFRSAQKGLAPMNAPPETFIVYSTAPRQIALDGSGRNGTFTKYLLKYISTPGLEISTLLRRVRSEVREETNGKQIPWEDSSLEKDFYFSHSIEKQPCKIEVKGKTYYPKIKLRSENKVMDHSEIELMVNLKNFYESSFNNKGNFKTSYKRAKINRNIIVLDITAGLMWRPIGLSRHTFQDAKECLKILNLHGYAGFNDWRLPTAEEAASLLRKKKNKFSLNTDPIFSCSKKRKNHQLIIWTGDELTTGTKKWAVVLTGAKFIILDESESINLMPVRTAYPDVEKDEREN